MSRSFNDGDSEVLTDQSFDELLAAIEKQERIMNLLHGMPAPELEDGRMRVIKRILMVMLVAVAASMVLASITLPAMTGG